MNPQMVFDGPTIIQGPYTRNQTPKLEILIVSSVVEQYGLLGK